MARVFKLFILLGFIGVLSGCGAGETAAPIEAPVEAPISSSTEELEREDSTPPIEAPLAEDGTETTRWTREGIPLTDMVELSIVDSILVEMVDPYGEIQRYPLQFTEHGLIKGTVDIMAPLSEQPSSAFTALGMSVFIEVDGQSSRITRNEVTLDFHVDDIQSYKNDEPFGMLPDICFYENGTLYAPFEVILRAFDLPYRYDENRLIIILHDMEEVDESEAEGH